MKQDASARVYGMSAQGGLHIGANTIYTSCDFLGSTIQVDGATALIGCYLDDCELVLPEGVDEVAVYSYRSRFVNNKVRGGKKVTFRT